MTTKTTHRYPRRVARRAAARYAVETARLVEPRRAAGWTLKRCCTWLNDTAKHPTFRGRKWSISNLSITLNRAITVPTVFAIEKRDGRDYSDLLY